jgi:ABC-type sugar transport system ATPase subunit
LIGHPISAPFLIQAVDVSKSFGHVTALRKVTFGLKTGETHALVGDNGAGKSTLIGILAGAIEPTDGRLLVDGVERAFRTPREAIDAGISVVYQNLALVGCRNIGDNIFLGRELTRYGFIARARMRAEAATALQAMRQMNVTDTRALVEDLSGGQRQAVAIARGVRLGSRVLILDEPTAALGVQESEEVLKILLDLKRSDRSMLLVSHNLAHVFRVADRITVMRSGRVVGTVDRHAVAPDDVVKMITGSNSS